MANKKATMTDLRLLIREFIKGTSKRKISEILSLSRTSIDVYLAHASRIAGSPNRETRGRQKA